MEVFHIRWLDCPVNDPVDEIEFFTCTQEFFDEFVKVDILGNRGFDLAPVQGLEVKGALLHAGNHPHGLDRMDSQGFGKVFP